MPVVVSYVVNSVLLVWERIGHLYINTRFMKTEVNQYVVSNVGELSSADVGTYSLLVTSIIILAF